MNERLGYMKVFWGLLWVLLPLASNASERVYMIGKIKILDTTHTKVVLFYDRGITNMNDCQREIQRGNRGQWRYHHHKFKKPNGYAQRISYYCVKSDATASKWYPRDRFDQVYKVDIRNTQMRISPQKSYSDCLFKLRKEVYDETNRFFCAKLSQRLQL